MSLMEKSINFRLGKNKKAGRTAPAVIADIMEAPIPEGDVNETLEVVEPEKPKKSGTEKPGSRKSGPKVQEVIADE